MSHCPLRSAPWMAHVHIKRHPWPDLGGEQREKMAEDRRSEWRNLMNLPIQVGTDSLATCCSHEKLTTITAREELFAPYLMPNAGPDPSWQAFKQASGRFIVLEKLIPSWR